tara:strand:- start:515 stop:1519 length:1005 start_codon:yes stop_codon:yes gene_type:complete
MKIFITGICGFIGSNLAEFYLKKKYEVSGCDNLIGGYLENINSKKIKFYKADCEKLEDMTKIMKNVDIVIHTAAYPHEGLSSFAPYEICKSNFLGSVSVFTAAIQNKVKRIVFCSSMARYGEIKPPFYESQTPKPVDPYGVSKLASEEILRILCETHGLEYNIAIPHNVIGQKQKYDDPFRNVVSIMTNLMLQNRRPIIFGDGEQVRSFSDIKDCIYCIDKLARDKKIKSEVFNIGPDEEFITINELYEILCNKLSFNKDPKYYADRPNEVKKAICSSDKAREKLNYKTTVSLSESIDGVIKYIRENKPRKFDYHKDLEILNKKTPRPWKEKLF